MVAANLKIDKPMVCRTWVCIEQFPSLHAKKNKAESDVMMQITCVT